MDPTQELRDATQIESDHPPGDRLAAFALGCVRDDEAATIEAHVLDCDTCRSVLEATPEDDLVSLVRTASAGSKSGARHPLRLVPGYEILSELGRGGMGIVYKARQIALDRIVALKTIARGAQADAEDLARFRTEAEAAARLQHPNIVQVFDVGEQDGQPYLAMELVAGGSLDSLLAGRPLPARVAAELIETLARAIQYAHERGILHRDLKPGNILLQKSEIQNPKSETNSNHPITKSKNPHAGVSIIRDSDFGFVSDFEFRASSLVPKITDFGLAKRLDAATCVTQTGTLLGTPSYMAPEQAEGRISDMGPHTDVYALGAILYEAVAGRPPFRAASTIETLEQVRSVEPVPPSRLQPSLPRDLQTICLKCLEKDRLRRYPTAEELADDLRRFLDGRPIDARPANSLERMVKWARRKPAQAGLLAVSAAALAVLVATTLVHNATLREHVKRAVAGETTASRQRDRADRSYRRASETVRQMIEQINTRNLPNVPRVTEFLLDEYEMARQFLVEQLQESDDQALKRDLGNLLVEMTKRQVTLGRSHDARNNLLHALELLERLPIETTLDRLHLAACYNTLIFVTPEIEGQIAYCRKSLELLETATAQDPQNRDTQNSLARSLHVLADCYRSKRALDDAATSCRRAITIRTALHEQDPGNVLFQWELAGSHENLSMIHTDARRYEMAAQESDRAVALLLPLVQEHRSEQAYAIDLAVMYLNRAIFWLDPSEIPVLHEKCTAGIELIQRVLASEPEQIRAKSYLPLLHANRARMSHEMQKHADAVADWDAAIRLGDEPTRTSARGMRLADLIACGRHAEATAEARTLAADPSASAADLYNYACVFALAAPLAASDATLDDRDRAGVAERNAAESVALLDRARQRGFFNARAMVQHMKQDSDLVALRERIDYRQLLATVESSGTESR